MTKVTLGEADAGIVYATDVTAAGADAEGRRDPGRHQRDCRVPDRAVTKERRTPTGAQAFIDFVLGEQGQKILASYGFLAP